MSFHKILERLREASKGQRGMKDSCSVSKYDLSELLCDFDCLDYQARLLVHKLESIEKERDEAQSSLDTLSTRFTALIQQNNTLAAENERLSEKLAAMESQEQDPNYCALKSITDDQVRKVAKAFWRRIYPYRNDYGIELPDPMPAEFMAHMATALTWVDKPVPADKPEVEQRCAECGPVDAGTALYCVECWDCAHRPAVAVPDDHMHVSEFIDLCKSFSSRTGSIYIGDVESALSGYLSAANTFSQSHSQQSEKQTFELLMRDIIEQEPADPDSDRTVSVNYEWLYSRIREAFCPSHESEQ